jgi:hypothetical protein
MNNVELVRIRLQREPADDTRVAVFVHLKDIEQANERLHQVARELRAWHAENGEEKRSENEDRPDEPPSV